METTALTREKKYLSISAFGNVFVGIVGLAVATLSSSQAILLDGLFNLTYFGTAIFTVKVASFVAGGDDERFPHGYSFFEPLVNGVKGTLVLGVSLVALVGAVQAIASGGRAIDAGAAIAYGVFASVTCGVIAVLTRRGAKETQSPLVRADAENWIVNAAVSSCVLLAFIGIFALRALELDAVVPYVDPAVVLTIVVLSIGVPVRMAWKALMGLLNRAPSNAIVAEVTRVVDASLDGLPVRERFIRVIQPGRHRMVLVHVVLPESFKPDSLSALDAQRAEMFHALSHSHAATILDVLFTADRQWGAPLSDGGSGAL